jgi:hypothetical protein
MDQRILWGNKDLTDMITEEMNADLSNRIAAGRVRQGDIAKFNQDNPHNMIDGFGEVSLSIDPDIYHAYRVQMKTEMKDPHYECWDDPDFCRYMWREFPEMRGSNSGRVVSSKGLVA